MTDFVKKTLESYEQLVKKGIKIRANVEEIKPLADFFIKNLKGKKILDVGCGDGRDAKYFAEQGMEVTGIDPIAGYVAAASKNVPNAKFIKMDMRTLNFSGNSFDGLWLDASFLHIPKAEAASALRGFHRILKVNGMIFISVKEGTEEKFVEEEEIERFYAFYQKQELSELLEHAGFKVLEIKRVPTKTTVWLDAFAIKA